MKATSISGLGDYEDIEKANDVVKRVENKALYMKKLDIGTLLFIPMERTKENCNKPFVYEIDNALYETLWTNKYNQLVEFYESEKGKPIIKQLSLFDL